MPNLGIPLNVGTLASCLAILMLLVDLATSKVKVYIPDGPTHDNTVQLLAIAFGVVFAIGIELLLPGVKTAQVIALAAGYGAFAGMSAIGRYHITATPGLDSQGATDLQGLLGAFQPAVEAPAPQNTAPPPRAQQPQPGAQSGGI